MITQTCSHKSIETKPEIDLLLQSSGPQGIDDTPATLNAHI